MDISQTGQTPGQTAARAATAPPPPASGTAISSDFETFLKMLTVQMQNQDPLNPIESSDYAVQLATFSGVEQQVQTNDLLRALGAGSGLSGLSQHAGWVGMQARVEGPVAFEGSPVEIHFDLPLSTASAELVVADPSGRELYRQPVSEGGPMMWSGTSPLGAQLLTGEYQLSVQTRSGSGQVETSPVSSYARVTEVRAGAEGPVAVMDSGALVPVGEITALREGI